MYRYTFNLLKRMNRFNKEYVKEYKDDCTICMTTNYCDVWVKLDCNHTFHECCIDKAYDYNKKCPLCRENIERTNH